MQVIQMPAKIFSIPNDVVVVAPLPTPTSISIAGQQQSPQCSLLETSHEVRHGHSFMRAQQQVQVVVQQHMSVVIERMAQMGFAECMKHLTPCTLIRQPRTAPIRRQGQEDRLVLSEVTAIAGHASSLASAELPRYRHGARLVVRVGRGHAPDAREPPTIACVGRVGPTYGHSARPLVGATPPTPVNPRPPRASAAWGRPTDAEFARSPASPLRASPAMRGRSPRAGVSYPDTTRLAAAPGSGTRPS